VTTGGIAGGKPGEVIPPSSGHPWHRHGCRQNLYVAMSEMGTCLRKFSPEGKLLWELRGDFFVDVVCADPDHGWPRRLGDSGALRMD